MPVQPYLFFEGRAEEAISFYRTVFGAEVIALFRMKDSPPSAGAPTVPPGSGDKIMHAELKIGGGSVMVSDGNCSGTTNFKGFSLSFAAPDDDSARAVFTALIEGGTVTMPMAATFFSSSFGMCTDKFGVPWMIIANAQ